MTDVDTGTALVERRPYSRASVSPRRTDERRFFRAEYLRESLGPVETRRRTDGITGRESVDGDGESRRGRGRHYYTTTDYFKLKERGERLFHPESVLGWFP